MAETELLMEIYASAIEDEGTPAQFAQLAEYFANVNNLTQAGHFHHLAGNPMSGMQPLAGFGHEHECIYRRAVR